MLSGHAVEKIDVLTDELYELPLLFEPTDKKISESSLVQRKKAVINLLVENRFPVKEIDDILEIEGVVSIQPPYAPENCISTNPIVLTRIHTVLSQIK